MDAGEPGGSVADPSGVLDRLDAVLDDAAALPLACLGPDETLAWLCRLQRLRARVDALACRSLTEAQNLPIDSPAVGRSSVADMVASHARVKARGLIADQRLAVWLRGYPDFAAAFSAGDLSRAHVHQLRQLDNPHTRRHLAEAQHYLVEAAQRCSWDDFLAVCRYWSLTFDPDGREPREQCAARSLSYRIDADGMISGRFRLDPLAGTAVTSAVEQQAQRLFRADTESDSNDRTASQRRADALVELVARGAQHPDQPLPAPLVHIVMSQKVAEDALARLASDATEGCALDSPGPVDSSQLPLQFDDVDQRCELIDGTPIHPHFALAALATATLRRMVFGPNGEILDLGRKARGFPLHLKQALLVRARGRCQSAGCSAPLAWLQADHLLPWNRHGPTATDNGQILCDPHNKAKRDRPPPETGNEISPDS